MTNIWPQATLEPRDCFSCMCVFSQNYKARQLPEPEAAESFCVSGLFISDYIPPRTPAGQIHKASIHGLWQGLHGNCGAWTAVIVSLDKNILLPRRPLKIEAGCNFGWAPRGIKKKSVTSPRLFIKSARRGAAAFLGKLSFRTLRGGRRGAWWALH